MEFPFKPARKTMSQGPQQYRKKYLTFLRGVGGLQKNVHMTFLPRGQNRYVTQLQIAQMGTQYFKLWFAVPANHNIWGNHHILLSSFSTRRICSRDAKRKQESGNVLVKIGWRKNSPQTSRKRSYFFVCSREQIRLVENGL